MSPKGAGWAALIPFPSFYLAFCRVHILIVFYSQLLSRSSYILHDPLCSLRLLPPSGHRVNLHCLRNKSDCFPGLNHPISHADLSPIRLERKLTSSMGVFFCVIDYDFHPLPLSWGPPPPFSSRELLEAISRNGLEKSQTKLLSSI